MFALNPKKIGSLPDAIRFALARLDQAHVDSIKIEGEVQNV